jgi:hypothetical protein
MALFGGDSKSSSTQTTQNFDNRIVADAEAQAVSNGGQTAKDNASPVSVLIQNSTNKSTNNSYVTVTTTDHGAIEFADKAVAGANQTVQDVLGISKANFDTTVDALENAYQDAKGGALIMQNITIGMLATIAMIGYFWLGRKGKA